MTFIINNCIDCRSENIGKTIHENCLNHFCYDCRKSFNIELVKLKKKIIYLDQNFYSHALNNKQIFLDLYSRLENMAKRQLIVCPYSEIHVQETSCYGRGNELWPYIVKISCGKNFKFIDQIREQQIITFFCAFLQGIFPHKISMNLRDAISGNAYDWCYPLPLEGNANLVKNIVEHYTPSQLVRRKKDDFLQNIINAIEMWGGNVRSFKDDYNLEIKDCVKYLITSNGQPSELFMLLHDIIQQYYPQKTEKDIVDFFKPDIFSKVPHINIQSNLWALIKQNIRAKKPSKKRIKEKYRSAGYDIDFLSVFSPYCDAIFTENQMASYMDVLKSGNSTFGFSVFSTNNISLFHDYLDEIEKNISKELEEDLQMVMVDPCVS